MEISLFSATRGFFGKIQGDLVRRITLLSLFFEELIDVNVELKEEQIPGFEVMRLTLDSSLELFRMVNGGSKLFQGMALLTITASIPGLKPVECIGIVTLCPSTTMVQYAVLFSGLYLIALGTGGIKPCVSSFGADQFDDTDTSERIRKTSSERFLLCVPTQPCWTRVQHMAYSVPIQLSVLGRFWNKSPGKQLVLIATARVSMDYVTQLLLELKPVMVSLLILMIFS